MKICFAINNFSAGGAERVLSSIVNYIANNFRHDVYVICFDDLSESAQFYMLIEKVNVNYITFSKALEQSVQILNEIKPDIVVSFLNPMNYIVSLATRITHIPHVACERNNPLYSPSDETERIHRDESFKEAEGCIFQTNLAANYFRDRIRGLYKIIRNPVSIDAEYCEYQERHNKFVAVGRYVKQKNYPVLLEAFRRFTVVYPNYKLEIYGKCSEYYNQILKIVDSLELNHNVKLMNETKQIHQHIRTAKAFISTSLYEGIPNALSEAVALGIPCIATDIPGSREIIRRYNSGILVSQNNIEEIVNAMCCVQSKDVFNKLTCNRNKIIIENSVEVVSNNFLEFFNLVVDNYKHYHSNS